MVKTIAIAIAIAIAKAQPFENGPFEIQPSKSPDFKWLGHHLGFCHSKTYLQIVHFLNDFGFSKDWL